MLWGVWGCLCVPWDAGCSYRGAGGWACEGYEVHEQWDVGCAGNGAGGG